MGVVRGKRHGCLWVWSCAGTDRDYALVEEHINNSTCLMGYRSFFRLTKPASM